MLRVMSLVIQSDNTQGDNVSYHTCHLPNNSIAKISSME